MCIKFFIELEHSSVKGIWMIQKGFRDDAMSAAQIKMCEAFASKMIKNQLKVTDI